MAVDKHGTLLMTDSLVEGNARAGVLFYGGGGMVTRSVMRANKVPVAVDQGAKPTLADDNLFVGNEENAVARGRGYKPAKLPEVVPSKP